MALQPGTSQDVSYSMGKAAPIKCLMLIQVD